MKAISIRNVPDHIYEELQNMAKTNRRSLQEQIKLILRIFNKANSLRFH